jgi:SH3 domain-containing YSC84-like protein 1
MASKTSSLKENQAVALFTINQDQPGDLGFKKGDIINVIKKTDKAEDWW